jgi:hypothetical protein
VRVGVYASVCVVASDPKSREHMELGGGRVPPNFRPTPKPITQNTRPRVLVSLPIWAPKVCSLLWQKGFGSFRAQIPHMSAKLQSKRASLR